MDPVPKWEQMFPALPSSNIEMSKPSLQHDKMIPYKMADREIKKDIL